MATGLKFTLGGKTLSFQTSDTLNEGIISAHIYDDDMPELRLNDFPLARADGQKFVSEFYGAKSIRVDGLIRSVTASGLDGQIDNTKLFLSPKTMGVLTVSRGTGDRNYAVAVKTFTVTRDSTDVTRAPFAAEFTCEPGFGQEPTYNAWTTFSGVTSGSFQFNVLTSGTAPYSPEIRLHIVAVSQLGNMTLTNLATGDILTLARVFSAGENLSVNTSVSRILVNGSGITYSGVMPSFTAVSGTNPILVTSTSGTQTFDVSVNYVPVYL